MHSFAQLVCSYSSTHGGTLSTVSLLYVYFTLVPFRCNAFPEAAIGVREPMLFARREYNSCIKLNNIYACQATTRPVYYDVAG
jgi:hypothetical protein